jgi:hypothetical protein
VITSLLVLDRCYDLRFSKSVGARKASRGHCMCPIFSLTIMRTVDCIVLLASMVEGQKVGRKEGRKEPATQSAWRGASSAHMDGAEVC